MNKVAKIKKYEEKTYFAIQTRKQEINDKNNAELSENVPTPKKS